MQAEPADDHGVEALDANLALVVGEDGVGFLAELSVAPAVLKLHDQRPAAGEGLQHFGEERDALLRAAEIEELEFVIALLVHTRVHTADAVERVVMEDDDLAVLRQLHVELRPVARAPGEAEGLQRVLGHGFILAVQAAVGEVPPPEGSLLPLGGAARGQQEHRQPRRKRGAPADHGGFFQLVGKGFVHRHIPQLR